MRHPTDDELEAEAQRLELVAPTDVEVVDMLRACKGRDAEKQAYIKGTQSGWNAAIEAAARLVKSQSENARKSLRRCGDEGHPEDAETWSAIVSHLDLAHDRIINIKKGLHHAKA